MMKRRTIGGILLTVLSLQVSNGQQDIGPPWWFAGEQRVIDGSSSLGGNQVLANVGQGKWITLQALEALAEYDLNTRELARNLIIPSIFDVQEPTAAELAQNFSPLTLGQLKAMAKPLYDTLNRVRGGVNQEWVSEQLEGFEVDVFQATQIDVINFDYVLNGSYPWNPEETLNRSNFSPATIGQVKAVFALDFSTWPAEDADSDGDGLPDSFEQTLIASNPSLTFDNILPEGDNDNDGLSNQFEFESGTLAFLADSDGDGYNDNLSVGQEFYFRLEEGELAVDSSNSISNGVLLGELETILGIDGGAVTLVSSNAAVQAALSSQLSDFSIAFWFRAGESTSSQTLWSAVSSAGQIDSLSIEGEGSLLFQLSGTSHSWVADYQLTDNLWHQVILARNVAQGEVVLYLDGFALDSPVEAFDSVLNLETITFGQLHQSLTTFVSGSRLAGDLDELRLYSRVLRDSEVRELFQPNDLDQDQLPDDYERSLTGDLGSLNGANDSDFDGVLDLDEWRQGSNPLDFFNDDPPEITLVSTELQTIRSGEVAPEPLIFEVTRDGVVLPNAPVEVRHLEDIGRLVIPGLGVVGNQTNLITDESGRISVFFEAN